MRNEKSKQVPEVGEICKFLGLNNELLYLLKCVEGDGFIQNDCTKCFFHPNGYTIKCKFISICSAKYRPDSKNVYFIIEKDFSYKFQ